MYTRPISLPRLRRVPSQFSWVDQRVVRERSIDQLRHEACALYLFLVTVADAQGRSFYAEQSVCQRLSLPPLALHRARQALIQGDLVAYDPPLSQVLALDKAPLVPAAHHPRMTTADTPMALKEVFTHRAETLS